MVIALVAIAAVPVSISLRRKAASEKLLAPAIRYHQARRKSNDQLFQLEVGLLHRSMHAARTQSQAAATALCRAMNLPEQPRPALRDAWRDCRFKARGVVRCLGAARDELRDATFHKNLSDYHGHAQKYYERLLKARVTKLPPFPAKLEAERRAIEDSLQRKMGKSLWEALEPPPSSQLMPGAPRLRPHDRPATARESTL